MTTTTTTATVETMSANLKEDVLDLAKKIEEGIEFDKKSGMGTETGNLYETNLPADLDIDTVKRVSDYNTTFIAAGAYAFGRIAVNAMSTSKGLERATLELKVGTRDSVAVTVDRTKEYTNRLDDSNSKIVKHGVVTTNYEVRAGKNAGQLKAARMAIAELANAKIK